MISTSWVTALARRAYSRAILHLGGVAAFVTLVACPASVAHAADGWYLAGRLGASILSTAQTNDPSGVEIEFGTGSRWTPYVGGGAGRPVVIGVT